jgi:hypothetical protein
MKHCSTCSGILVSQLGTVSGRCPSAFDGTGGRRIAPFADRCAVGLGSEELVKTLGERLNREVFEKNRSVCLAQLLRDREDRYRSFGGWSACRQSNLKESAGGLRDRARRSAGQEGLRMGRAG